MVEFTPRLKRRSCSFIAASLCATVAAFYILILPSVLAYAFGPMYWTYSHLTWEKTSCTYLDGNKFDVGETTFYTATFLVRLDDSLLIGNSPDVVYSNIDPDIDSYKGLCFIEIQFEENAVEEVTVWPEKWMDDWVNGYWIWFSSAVAVWLVFVIIFVVLLACLGKRPTWYPRSVNAAHTTSEEVREKVQSEWNQSLRILESASGEDRPCPDLEHESTAVTYMHLFARRPPASPFLSSYTLVFNESFLDTIPLSFEDVADERDQEQTVRKIVDIFYTDYEPALRSAIASWCDALFLRQRVAKLSETAVYNSDELDFPEKGTWKCMEEDDRYEEMDNYEVDHDSGRPGTAKSIWKWLFALLCIVSILIALITLIVTISCWILLAYYTGTSLPTIAGNATSSVFVSMASTFIIVPLFTFCAILFFCLAWHFSTFFLRIPKKGKLYLYPGWSVQVCNTYFGDWRTPIYHLSTSRYSLSLSRYRIVSGEYLWHTRVRPLIPIELASAFQDFKHNFD